MPTAELTLRLPAEEVEFLKAYAQEHGTTAAELLATYVKRLRANGQKPLHPDVANITGLIPVDTDVTAEYRQHMLDKHK